MDTKPIIINEDISLRAILDEEDPGNIFIDQSRLKNYWSRLVLKLSELVPETIHVRALMYQQLDELIYKASTAAAGVNAFVWLSDAENEPPLSYGYQAVTIPAKSRLAREEFIIFKNELGMRALIMWSEDETSTGVSGGVLVTDPRQVKKLLDYLNRFPTART
jgi:hypothetical protein